MKKYITMLMVVALCGGCAWFAGAKLDPAGVYGTSGTGAPLPELYVVDASFDLAYSTLDFAFKYERDNRQLLWKLNPHIKHSLDKLRTEAQRVNSDFALARATYLASPSSTNLTTLNRILGKLQAANAAALTVIQSKGQ